MTCFAAEAARAAEDRWLRPKRIAPARRRRLQSARSPRSSGGSFGGALFVALVGASRVAAEAVGEGTGELGVQ